MEQKNEHQLTKQNTDIAKQYLFDQFVKKDGISDCHFISPNELIKIRQSRKDSTKIVLTFDMRIADKTVDRIADEFDTIAEEEEELEVRLSQADWEKLLKKARVVSSHVPAADAKNKVPAAPASRSAAAAPSVSPSSSAVPMPAPAAAAPQRLPQSQSQDQKFPAKPREVEGREKKREESQHVDLGSPTPQAPSALDMAPAALVKYKKQCDAVFKRLQQKGKVDEKQKTKLLEEIEAILVSAKKNEKQPAEFDALQSAYGDLLKALYAKNLLSGANLLRFANNYFREKNAIAWRYVETYKKGSHERPKQEIAKIYTQATEILGKIKDLPGGEDGRAMLEGLVQGLEPYVKATGKNEVKRKSAAVAPVEVKQQQSGLHSGAQVGFLPFKPESEEERCKNLLRDIRVNIDKDIQAGDFNSQRYGRYVAQIAGCEQMVCSFPNMRANQKNIAKEEVQLQLDIVREYLESKRVLISEHQEAAEKLEGKCPELHCPLSSPEAAFKAQRPLPPTDPPREPWLVDAMTVSSGYAFNKAPLEEYFLKSGTKKCPVTGEDLECDAKGEVRSFPNLAVRERARAAKKGDKPTLWECSVQSDLSPLKPVLVSSGITYSNVDGEITFQEEEVKKPAGEAQQAAEKPKPKKIDYNRTALDTHPDGSVIMYEDRVLSALSENLYPDEIRQAKIDAGIDDVVEP